MSAMSAASAVQRPTDVASCSYTSSTGKSTAPHRLAGQSLTKHLRHAGQRCRRRRKRLLRAVTAELLSQTAVADAISPLAALIPVDITNSVSNFLRSAVEDLIGVSPSFLHPLEIVLGTDLVTVAELQPSTNTVLRLGVRIRMPLLPTCMHHEWFKPRACFRESQSRMLPHGMLTWLMPPAMSMTRQLPCRRCVRLPCRACPPASSKHAAFSMHRAGSRPIGTLCWHSAIPLCSARQTIWYAFFSQPAPAIGLLDFYLFGPAALALEKKWKVEDLTLRERMGGGNFGQVFEGIINPPGGGS